MSAKIGNLKKGLLFVISAPAGTGKTTLVEKLVTENSCIEESTSLTTRSPRVGEQEGSHYFFVSREEFEERIARGDFLEYVDFCGNYYGTSREQVEEKQNKGKHVILTIDTQGALYLKGKVKAVYIFLLPPSLQVQKQRLESRQTETKEAIEKRLLRTPLELQVAHCYDYIIVNDNLQVAYSVLESIIVAEEHRVSQLLGDEACPHLLDLFK